jgi:hypothetical protein
MHPEWFLADAERPLDTALPLAHNLPRKVGISGRLSQPE